MVKANKRHHDVISKDKSVSTTKSQTQAHSGSCFGCSSPNSGPIAAADLQFGSQGNLGFGLHAMTQDPFLTAFTDMMAGNSFAPNWPSSVSRPMSMALTGNWGSNVTKTFKMPNIPHGLLDRPTFPSVTSNGLLLSSPYDTQNPHGINFPTSWDTADLVNNLLTVWPTGQEFSSRSEFEQAMESAASFGGVIPKVNQTMTANMTPTVMTKSDYTVVNDGFYSTTTEDAAAETDEKEEDAAVESDDETDVSDTDVDSGSDETTKSRRRSRRNSSRSQSRKKKNCEGGKCPLSRDGRRRNRRSRSTSGRNRRSKSTKQSGGRRRVSRRSKSVQSRQRRSNRKSTAGKRRSSRR